MEKMIILNHKINLEYDQVYEYIDEFNKIKTDNNIIICPSNIYLDNFINHSTWGIGAQNVSDKLDGDYTGEISTLQLKSLGVEYSIVGHYERKKYFNESNSLINKKVISCLESNIMPILCFGEDGDRDKYIKDLEENLKDIEHIDFIIFAYEPLKLDEIPGIDILEEDINYIYDYLCYKYKRKINIVYCGSITI